MWLFGFLCVGWGGQSSALVLRLCTISLIIHRLANRPCNIIFICFPFFHSLLAIT